MKKKSISGEATRLLELGVQRIPFTETVDNKMRQLRGRSGITPNILARYGFCLSLEEAGIPADPFVSEKAGRDINRNTLLGDHEAIYISLLRSWCAKTDGCKTNEEFDRLFVYHMNRGFELLSARMRNVSDLANLVAREAAKHE